MDLSPHELSVMSDCITKSTDIWLGKYDDEIYCVWGLIPPTILSNRAYLWLYVDQKKVLERQFIFIRKSQIAVKEMLDIYDVLFGVTGASAEKTIRWLKWLGAEFEQGRTGYIEFKIRRR